VVIFVSILSFPHCVFSRCSEAINNVFEENLTILGYSTVDLIVGVSARSVEFLISAVNFEYTSIRTLIQK
jgi:hypothetical protein